MGTPLLSQSPMHKSAGNADTPYLRAKEEWDSRIGTSVVRAKNWRLAFFAQSVCFGITLTILAIQVTKHSVVPVIVGIDPAHGKPTVIGPATQQNYSPGLVEIKYFLSQFVRFVRSVPNDQVIIRQNWLRAYSFLRKDAAGLLNELTNNHADSPLKKIGSQVVSIQPLSVVQIPETSSYQVRWSESVYSIHGMKIEEYTMLGTFNIELEPPSNEQTLLENPLGLFIKNFQWNREL